MMRASGKDTGRLNRHTDIYRLAIMGGPNKSGHDVENKERYAATGLGTEAARISRWRSPGLIAPMTSCGS